MNLVLLEAAGRPSGDRFLKYHKQTLWRPCHRHSDGQVDLDWEKAKASSLCFQSVITQFFIVISLSSS